MPTLTPEETRNEQVIRMLYALADGKTKGTPKFVSQFGPGGGWAESRVLQVQYQNITSHDIADLLDGRTQVVVWPPSLASGTLVYPYAKAKGNRHA